MFSQFTDYVIEYTKTALSVVLGARSGSLFFYEFLYVLQLDYKLKITR